MSEQTPSTGTVSAAAAEPDHDESTDGENAVTVLWADDRSEVKLSNPQVIDAVIWGTTEHGEFTVSKTYDAVVGAAMEPIRLQTITKRTAGDYRLRFARQ